MYFSYSKPISKAIGLKPSRTGDYLKQLVDEGVLEVEGEYKNRKYRIKSEWLDWMGIWCRDMQKGGYEFHATKKVSFLIFCRKNCVILRQNCMCNEWSNY